MMDSNLENSALPFDFDNDLFVSPDSFLERDKRRQTAKAEAIAVNFINITVFKQYRKESVCRPSKMLLQSLDLFKLMAVDVLFEIFAYLHPIDLINLSATVPCFGSLLENIASNTVWKSAFHNYSDIPKIPSELLGYKWARLLFGLMKCETCGRSPAPLNIPFRQRLCTDCGQEEFMFLEEGKPREFRRLLRESKTILVDPLDPEALESLSDSWPPFHRAEVEDISGKVGTNQERHEDNPDGKQAIEDNKEFRLSRLTYTTEIGRHAEEGLNWAKALHELYEDYADDHIIGVLNTIKTRFKSMKFRLEDVDEAQFEVEPVRNVLKLCGVKRLSKKRFSKLRPSLEAAVLKARDQRLEKERKSVIRARLDVLKEMYNEYQRKHCPPSTWHYIPPLFSIRLYEPFQRLIEDPSDRTISEEDLAEDFKQVPRLIRDWIIYRKKQLVADLPSTLKAKGLRRETNSADCEYAPELEDEVDFSVLDLATSVFTCHGSVRSRLRPGRCLIGWHGAAPHLRCPSLEKYWGKKLHFNANGSTAAASIAELLGLDPATTTFRKLDGLDKRFICTTCPPTVREHSTGKEVYTWRDAVYHFTDRAHEEPHVHLTPTWGLLSPEAEAWIKSLEEPDPVIKNRLWTCNRCPEHHSNPVNRDDAIAHVKTTHRIRDPIEGSDFALMPYYNHYFRNPALLPDDIPREYLCLKCPGGKRSKHRLFTGEGVRHHLRDIHHVGYAVEGRDLRKVRPILRTTEPLPSTSTGNFESSEGSSEA